MLSVNNVSIQYKNNTVLNNVNFTAAPGECIGLLGVNGSGKSSLLRTISGIQKLQSGDVNIDNISLSGAKKEFQKHLGFVTQENPLIEELSGLDNLLLWTRMKKTELIEFLNTPTLKPLNILGFIDKPVKNLSGGMKKRLSIASCLINNPRILLLDEPFAALDMVAKEDIAGYIISFVKNGGTVITASHDESLFRICTRVYVLHDKVLTDIRTLPPNSYTNLLRRTINE